jgi:hypothetical protein
MLFAATHSLFGMPAQAAARRRNQVVGARARSADSVPQHCGASKTSGALRHSRDEYAPFVMVITIHQVPRISFVICVNWEPLIDA